MLECNNGTIYVPLVLSSRCQHQGSYQILTIDGSLYPDVDVKVTGAEIPGREIVLQPYHSMGAATVSENRISYSNRKYPVFSQGTRENLSTVEQPETDVKVRTLCFPLGHSLLEILSQKPKGLLS
jgi:hypothetical protein